MFLVVQRQAVCRSTLAPMTSLSYEKAGQSLDCAALTKRVSIVIVGVQRADADALGECRPTCT